MKSLRLAILLTLFLTLVNVHSAWALASGLPSHDTYIDYNEPDENFNDDALQVIASGSGCSETIVTYMQWDLTDIPGNATVATAALILTTTYVLNTSNAYLTLCETSDTWDEAELTWNNRPAVSTAIVTQTAPTVAGQQVVFGGAALRDYIADQASGDGKVSFVLRLDGTCSDAWTVAIFADREDFDNGGPYLLLLNPTAVKKSALRISGLDMQWPVVGLLVLGVLGSLARRRRALIEGGFE